mmetsp:Transcript_836/g.2028  ORF Transcript_836/g.2028 Transcript_836/m.2028 type:complete len:292 (-) Transcript_836:163-1038(-)
MGLTKRRVFQLLGGLNPSLPLLDQMINLNMLNFAGLGDGRKTNGGGGCGVLLGCLMNCSEAMQHLARCHFITHQGTVFHLSAIRWTRGTPATSLQARALHLLQCGGPTLAGTIRKWSSWELEARAIRQADLSKRAILAPGSRWPGSPRRTQLTSLGMPRRWTGVISSTRQPTLPARCADFYGVSAFPFVPTGANASDVGARLALGNPWCARPGPVRARQAHPADPVVSRSAVQAHPRILPGTRRARGADPSACSLPRRARYACPFASDLPRQARVASNACGVSTNARSARG